MIETPLHITVGAVPSIEIGNQRILAHELRLAKAAILYADKARLCSVGASIALLLRQLGESSMSRADRAQLFLDLESTLNLDDEAEGQAVAVRPLLREFIQLSKRNSLLLTRQQRESLAFHGKMIDEVIDPLKDELVSEANAFGMDEIRRAIDSGVLEVHQFKFGIADLGDASIMIPEYMDLIQETLASTETHPLFDGDTANVVEKGIASGDLTVAKSAKTRGRQAGLVADLFERLPVFDIPMDALLDVRTELARPLIHFRAEMVKLSFDIESAQWDADFPADVQTVVQSTIQPALLEIEDKLKSVEFAEFWITRIADKWTSAAGLIGAPAASFGAAIGSTAGILAALAGAAVFAQAGSFERTKQRQEIERNGLYFFHRLHDLKKK